MKPVQTFFTIMSDAENEKMYQCVLELLENPGMRIEAPATRAALARKGAQVDEASGVVQFPREMIDEVLELAIAEEKARLDRCKGDTVKADGAIAFNWHVAHMTKSPEFDIALGGGCTFYYDYKTNSCRYGNEADLIKMLHLAEGISQIARCGNPFHCNQYADGSDVPVDMVPLTTAAMVAKNSSKPGSTYLANAWQLEYAMAIGEVIKGPEEYRLQPLFINNNDTVPPLELNAVEALTVEALAKKGLPVMVLVMPLMGLTGPVTVFSNAVIATAEILGVWAGAKAVNPQATLEAAVVSGVMEPRTGNVCFSAPEVLAIDLAAAQFFRSRGLRCGTGVGLIDAPAPGVAAAYERAFKTSISAAAGESMYPVGMLGGCNIFSPEQLILDIDIHAASHRFLQCFDGQDLDTAVELVREKGIGGFFMDSDHTLANFRKNIWVPQIFERVKTNNPKDMSDPIANAYDRWNQIIEATAPYHLPDEKAKEIDKILTSARNSLKSTA